MGRLLICLLLVQAGAAQLPQTPASPPATDAIILGRVLDPAGAGVPGATVALQSTSTAGPSSQRVLSDDEGRYFFDRLQPGPYQINVTKTGWVPSMSGKRRQA